MRQSCLVVLWTLYVVLVLVPWSTIVAETDECEEESEEESEDEKAVLCGLVALFNPAGYRSRYENFHKFRERSRRQKLWVLTIQLRLGALDQDLQIGRDTDGLIVIDGDDENVLWQKERLLNIGLNALPRECKYVAWLDAELLFTNDHWVQDAIDALEAGFQIIQPFEYVLKLPRGVDWMEHEHMRWTLDKGDGLLTPGFGVSVSQAKSEKRRSKILGSQRLHGYTGFAWAAKRSTLETMNGFFDQAIVGGADALMAHAFCGHFMATDEAMIPYYYKNRLEGEMLTEAFHNWAKKSFRVVQGKVGSIQGTVMHLWHGSKEDRQYATRFQILSDFSPAHDLIKDICKIKQSSSVGYDLSPIQNCFTWRYQKNKQVMEMFEKRKEDHEQ